MKRLLATVWCDLRLQLRNGFYLAAAFVALALVIALRWLPISNLSWWLPGIVLSNLLVGTFYFIAGLVLLEKSEGTLEAQVVSPLRGGEYLASKVATLAALALVENLIVVFLLIGASFSIWPLAAGVALVAVLYSLFGFIVVVRYDSINEFLFPSFLLTAPLPLPLLDYFGIWRSWLFYLHPVQAPLLLIQAAFEPLAAWQWAYSVLYAGGWVVLAVWWSRRVFHRFVVAAPGAAR